MCRLVLIAFWALSSTACGGETVTDPATSNPDAPDVDPPDSPDATGLPPESKLEKTPLGTCAGSFPDNGARPCNYQGLDGKCYETRQDACDCICPRTRDSFCVSATYQGEGQRTEVDCY